MTDPRKLLLGIVVLVTACGEVDRPTGDEAAATQAENALVITSNYPLYFFASRIAEGVSAAPEIVYPDIEGDPAFWSPSAEQIQLLQSADAVILNGAGAESWLGLITLDRRRLVDTSLAIVDQLIPLDESVQHQHGPEGEHSHQGTAFTLWLDPQLAIAQAQSVTNTLIELAPMVAPQLRENMAKLQQEFMLLDTQLADVFTLLEGKPLLFSHPVYQYLQQRYGISGQSVHWEPEIEPSTSAWIELQQILTRQPTALMIWEDEPLSLTAERLSRMGLKVVTFHTVANRPAEGDYLSVMRANAERVASLLAQ